jgi:hypothetical protein
VVDGEVTTTGSGVAAVEEPVERDPFAPIEASPRGATVLTVLALVAAALSLVGGLAPLTGPVGMGLGLVAHVKGGRFGMPATIIAAVAMVLGFSIASFLRV